MRVGVSAGKCDGSVGTLQRHSHMLLDNFRPRSHPITRAHTMLTPHLRALRKGVDVGTSGMLHNR